MKQPIRYLLSILLFFLLIFALGKVGFVVYNHASADFGAWDVVQAWWNGLTLDMAMAAYLLMIPWLCCLVGIWWPRFALRRVLRPYYVAVGLILTVIIAADIVLYEHWQFKMDASIYNYLNANNGAAESVSVGFIIACVVALVVFTLLLSVPAIRLTPRSFAHQKGRGKATPTGRRAYGTWGMLLIGVLLVAVTWGGRENGTLSVGPAYYSPKLFLNHAAVNTPYSLLASTLKMGPYAEQFRYLPAEEAARTFQGLYPSTEGASTDSLLRTSRPNVLLIQLESYNAQFFASLGGLKDVSPNLDRHIREGILFTRCYANSFRTDRGTVSAMSGHVSYPTMSIMKYPDAEQHIAALPKTLQRQDYTTDYTYGGSIATMGKGDYLRAAGYQRIYSEPDFHLSPEERTTWGASDERVVQHMMQLLTSRTDTTRWMSGFQNIDSHEPFTVPYNRLEDKVQNAFAYSDHCLGLLLDSLKASPLWDNLLVVIYADHGIMYRQSYEDPEFFHIPLIWLGGAVREPRRINVLMNQSDIAATLLGQMGISHADYPWSRNVLSPHYTQPFAYSTYPSGIMLMDGSGVSIYDINADRTIVGQDTPGSDRRVHRAKAILQSSYDRLAGLGITK